MRLIRSRAEDWKIDPKRVGMLGFSAGGEVVSFVACTPGGSRYENHLTIAHAVINPDGSFAATGSQTGVFGGANATFNYSFTGNYEGLSASGVPQAYGSLREDITYSANGASYTCTTNNLTWSATHK